MKLKHIFFVLVVAGCSSVSSWAAVKLPAVLGGNMVIQQGKPFRIWGMAEPGEAVTADIAGRSGSAKADATGRFSFELAPLDAKKDTGPLELSITGGDGKSVKFRNVVVGEVWLCSGQSNMRLTVKECASGDKEIAAANYESIRLFYVPDADSTEPQFTMNAQWRACSPKTVGGFSAAAYYFGRELHKQLGVPIGLIDSSRGYSPAEAWLPEELLASNPITKPIMDRQATLKPRYEELEKQYATDLAAWKEERRAATQPAAGESVDKPAATQPLRPRPRRVWGVDRRLRPAGCYNAMLYPLAPYSIAGVVWYQGESNATRAEQYRTLLPMLIDHWRKLFAQPDMPFGIVQLTDHVNKENAIDSAWAELRDAQLTTVRSVPHTGLAVTNDVGEPFNIHPVNKQDVGKRLAAWALARVYERPDQPVSPLYSSFAIEGSAIRIRFDDVGKGLAVKGNVLAGFEIAGADRKYVPAEARIDGQTIFVSSPSVTAPVAVRYNWTDSPKGNLFSVDGLPASPFRTDDWPLLTAGVRTVDWQ